MSSNRREFVQSIAVAGAVAAVSAAVSPSPANAAEEAGPSYAKYKSAKIQINGEVATVTIENVDKAPQKGERGEQEHWELGEMFAEMRGDPRFRIVVITGPGNGIFHAGKHLPPTSKPIPPDQEDEWYDFQGLRRFHQEMAESQKIFVAKVNGDAISMGSSLVFAADIIVAQEDAIIADQHMGESGGIVPGDGGCALIPLFMSPAKAKEYLLLAKSYTAAELARLGIINYDFRNI